MLSEAQIVARLEEKGLKSGEVRATMRELAQLIIAKTAAAYLASLPERDQEAVRGLSEHEAASYIADHRSEFPPMSQEEFERIHDATWEEYFTSTS